MHRSYTSATGITSTICTLLGAVLLSTQPTCADKLKVSRQILLPDGKPAVGAKVLIRTLNHADGTLKQDAKSVTDETGTFAVEVEEDKEDANADPFKVTGYIMVDAPGAALTFEGFNNWRRRPPGDVKPLRLTAGYVVSGKVVTNQPGTNQQAPVADARIVIQDFSSGWSPWRLNHPQAGIVTPELTGTSAADGTFTLRPIAINQETFGSGPPVVRVNISAKATIEGKTWAGATELSPQAVGAPAPEKPNPFSIITMYPTLTVRGQVIREATGQPVAGAKVRLRGDPGAWVVTVAPTITDKTGHFEFTGVPGVFQLFAEVTHPDLASGWIRIGEERLAALNRNATEAGVYENVMVKLRPWATVSGQIIEEETGKAPPAEHLMKSQLHATYEEGYNDGRIRVGRAETIAQINPDGKIEMKMAVGRNHLLLFSALYFAVERPMWMDVPATGVANWLLKVRKKPSYYVRFTTDDPAKLKNTEIFLRKKGETGDGAQIGGVPLGYWTNPTQNWGDTVEIRVTRFINNERQELVPWTAITADPKNWPLVMPLP